jgi:hypothetical protein
LLEDRASGLQRRHTPNWEGKFYGFKDEYRTKGINRWEHRTMSSWITSPYVAAAILCLSKVVMYEVLNNPFFNPDIDFPNAVFVQMKTDEVRKKFPAIWKQIKKMKLYPKYKKYIDVIKFLVDNERNWFPSSSMKEAWGLVRAEPPKKLEPINLIEIEKVWDVNNNEIEKVVNPPKPLKKDMTPQDYLEWVKYWNGKKEEAHKEKDEEYEEEEHEKPEKNEWPKGWEQINKGLKMPKKEPLKHYYIAKKVKFMNPQHGKHIEKLVNSKIGEND